MAYNQPTITEHQRPLINTFLSNEYLGRGHEHAEQAGVAAASREAAMREMAHDRALNPPRMRPQMPGALRGATLPDDFDAAKIDEAIYQRGVAFNRDKLLALGRSRFGELLEQDAKIRSVQRVLFSDLTSWPSVAASFAAATGAFSGTSR